MVNRAVAQIQTTGLTSYGEFLPQAGMNASGMWIICLRRTRRMLWSPRIPRCFPSQSPSTTLQTHRPVTLLGRGYTPCTAVPTPWRSGHEELASQMAVGSRVSLSQRPQPLLAHTSHSANEATSSGELPHRSAARFCYDLLRLEEG